MKKNSNFLYLMFILFTSCSFISFANASEKNEVTFDDGMEISRKALRKSAYGKNILEKAAEIFKLNRIGNNGSLIKNFLIKFENKEDYKIAEKYWMMSRIEEPEIWRKHAKQIGFYVDVPEECSDKFKNYCFEHNLKWVNIVDEHDKENEKIFFYFNDDKTCKEALNIVENFFNIESEIKNEKNQ